MSRTIASKSFFQEYHGHRVEHLKLLFSQGCGGRRCIWLAGDSSLDNKHWFKEVGPATNGYEKVLVPPETRQDVCYHFNHILKEKHNGSYVCVNAAVEESTIGVRMPPSPSISHTFSQSSVPPPPQRFGGEQVTAESDYLLPQDVFIRDNIRSDDILVVSVGGNDIALRPTASTIFNILLMQYLNSISSISSGPSRCFGMPHFVTLFRDNMKNYLERLVSKTKPKMIVVSCIYYPDEAQTGSWSDATLTYLGYNTNPAKLQASIKAIFEYAISDISIDGVKVVPFAMFKVMDGKNSSDYVARVEPSASGGRKLAEEYLKVIFESLPGEQQ